MGMTEARRDSRRKAAGATKSTDDAAASASLETRNAPPSKAGPSASGTLLPFLTGAKGRGRDPPTAPDTALPAAKRAKATKNEHEIQTGTTSEKLDGDMDHDTEATDHGRTAGAATLPDFPFPRTPTRPRSQRLGHQNSNQEQDDDLATPDEANNAADATALGSGFKAGGSGRTSASGKERKQAAPHFDNEMLEYVHRDDIQGILGARATPERLDALKQAVRDQPPGPLGSTKVRFHRLSRGGNVDVGEASVEHLPGGGKTKRMVVPPPQRAGGPPESQNFFISFFTLHPRT